MRSLTSLYRFPRQMVAALALLAVSLAANAQAYGNIGNGLMDATCQFLSSPIVIFIFVVAIVACVVLLVLNEGKGLGSRVVQIAIGAAVILSIGTIIGFLGLHGTINC